MHRPTITDVAKRAGVAGKTVSRLINGENSISAKTRAKIESAIAELHFRPNVAARALRSASSYLIAVFNNNPSPHYVADVIRGASQVCRQSGYYLTLEEFAIGDEHCAARIDRFLRSVRIAGAILIPPLTDNCEVLTLLERYSIPYVRMSPATEIDRSDSVVANDAVGVEQLVEHLWTMGHRDLAIVTGPDTHLSSRIRRDVFFAAAKKLGCDEASILVRSGDFTFGSGLTAGRGFLEAKSRPSAIFASNDEMAAGLITAIGEAGLSIPGDIAVAGFDDSEVASLIWPALTTIAQSITEQARCACELLVSRSNRSTHETVILPVSLVIRKSTYSP